MNKPNLKLDNKSFFIFGYFGWFNAGDDAIGIALIKGLSERYPLSNISISVNDDYFLSNNISDNKIQQVNFNFLSILKAVNNSDNFIIAGGTHFQDQDKSLFLKIKVFLFFTVLVKFANLINRSPVLFGHGLGPIKSTWTTILVKVIFKNSKFIIVRDTDSYNFVTLFGFKTKCFLGFDLTALLFEPSLKILPKKNIIIGVSILPFYSIYEDNPSKDEKFIKIIEKCIKEIWDFNNNLKIHLFAFNSSGKHSDEQILLHLSNLLKDTHNRIKIIKYSGNIFQLYTDMEKCDYFIGMRYHSSLFAYLLKKPEIIIDYQEKCKSLANEILLPKNALIPLEDLELSFCQEVNGMLKHPESYCAQLSLENAKNRVKKMYDYL